ncbi:peptidase S8 [Peribacillus cavernae]|uniref:Peptidase S8 n=1 Tax=Peribacillus cavernae TaxID=1674310 RepID=A0A433HRJ8_9BACI|nr:S8 family serine peptidase [Peribacillus cavernae]MDQ0218780.1 cell wall-associated protease [Peribacillus cavernae]RUQ30991.1 peptidase S8 [Peribacillus cavernae]
MKKGKINCLIALVFMFTLCFSQLPQTKIQAAESDSIIEEQTLTISTPVESTLTSTKNVHWYKVVPSDEDIARFTHFRIKLQSKQELNISVYSSLENAIDNNTFDRYLGYSFEEGPSQIDFPISWKGPYYIKVEYFGQETAEEGTGVIVVQEEAGKNAEAVEPVMTDAPYTISYDGVTLPPSNQSYAEECPAELSTDQRKNGKSILQDLRTIRETVLSRTDNGQDLSSLYYKAAPYITTKMIFGKEAKQTRENVYQDLVQLKSLFVDIAESGSESGYTITDQDQEAINDLYNISRNAVPDSLKEKIDQIADKAGLSNVKGLPVSAILLKAELAETKPKLQDRYIVKLKAGKKLNSIQSDVKKYGVKSINPLKGDASVFENMFVAQLSTTGQSKAAAKQFKATAEKISDLPEVDFVEQVQQYHALSTDSQYSYQWSLKNDGTDGVKNADIQYEKLNDLLKGKNLKDTVIAVVDTGVDHSLADLNSKVNTDSGYNYIDRSSNAMDDNGHGTHVSGIITAAANNQYSMAGINSFAKILPVKVLDAMGSGDTEQIAYGIKYAADHGAKVINLSLGGPYSRTIEYALAYANKKNVTIVAASGNEALDELSYPASSKYAISVGATNRIDLVSDYSNYGKGLDLVAPGTEIPSLVPDGNMTYMSGTSMATPHVAAVAGLLLSENPNLKPNEVEKILTDTAKNVAFEEQDNQPPEDSDYPEDDEEGPYPVKLPQPIPGYDPVSGWGRLNAYGATSAVELKAKVNPILNYHTTVSGTAKSGSIVKVMSGEKIVATGTANRSGVFTVKMPVQKADQMLSVVIKNNSAETAIRAVVEKAPEKPIVNRLTNNDTKITGKAAKGLTVKIKDSTKKVIATSKVKDNGSFEVPLKSKLKEKTVLYITVLDGYKESLEVKVTVADVIPPSAPKISTVSDRDTMLKGKTEAYAALTATVKGKTIGTGKANAKGEFQVKIKKQKAGTEISVTAKDPAGNTSKATKTKVIDKTAPSAPKVTAVTNKSTIIKGKTEPSAAVTVKAGKKTIGTGKANSKGEYSIKIAKQKAYTILSISAKDQVGNTSIAVKSIVKKAK